MTALTRQQRIENAALAPAALVAGGVWLWADERYGWAYDPLLRLIVVLVAFVVTWCVVVVLSRGVLAIVGDSSH